VTSWASNQKLCINWAHEVKKHVFNVLVVIFREGSPRALPTGWWTLVRIGPGAWELPGAPFRGREARSGGAGGEKIKLNFPRSLALPRYFVIKIVHVIAYNIPFVKIILFPCIASSAACGAGSVSTPLQTVS